MIWTGYGREREGRGTQHKALHGNKSDGNLKAREANFPGLGVKQSTIATSAPPSATEPGRASGGHEPLRRDNADADRDSNRGYSSGRLEEQGGGGNSIAPKTQ